MRKSQTFSFLGVLFLDSNDCVRNATIFFPCLHGFFGLSRLFCSLFRTLTGDLEHDLVLCALLLLARHVEAEVVVILVAQAHIQDRQLPRGRVQQRSAKMCTREEQPLVFQQKTSLTGGRNRRDTFCKRELCCMKVPHKFFGCFLARPSMGGLTLHFYTLRFCLSPQGQKITEIVMVMVKCELVANTQASL